MATRSTTSRVTRPTTSAVTGNGVSGGGADKNNRPTVTAQTGSKIATTLKPNT